MKKLFAVVFCLCIATALFAGDALTKGSKVAAQYEDGLWYLGTISDIDGDECSITYADGSDSNVSKDKIRLLSKTNKPASGERVLACWSDGRFYAAKVTKVSANKATVKWEDGSEPSDLAFDMIVRNIGNYKEPEKKANAVIRKNGSIIGEISSSGTVRLNGSIVGEFESNGTVRKNGSIVGSIASDGTIRKNGSIVGHVDTDGTVRKNGSIIGSIDDDGTVRENGSIIGDAENADRKQAAAFFFFFFLE